MSSKIPGLRSPYEKVGGLVAFGRTLDKIRLHAVGQLPESYHRLLGVGKVQSMDARVCRFLNVEYAFLQEQVKEGRSDEAILTAAMETGRKPNDEQVEIFNGFFCKRGWRDEMSSYLQKIVVADGFAADAALTFFDHMDLDEGRPLRFTPDPAPPITSVRGTNIITGLRSPYETVGGIVHFGRMLDKIRLHGAGRLPEEWERARGVAKFFDGICCRFLGIDYAALETIALEGGSDDSLLDWAFTNGRHPNEEEILIWNGYMTKRGWRDEHTQRVHFRLEEMGAPVGAALTMFDYIDLDEGRPPRFLR